MRPFVLHAHFYQPERLNPWTGALDAEPSAAPDRDWNERILRECYHPNGNARILDEQGRIERIVNNYEQVSFNFGPTLLTWMEAAHPRTYARILDGDWRSVVRRGHGNALAQAYNHMILPLASERDRRTQVHWGLADFRHRFGREPEGIWLPETAADQPTIDTLIDARVRFTVLAPRQAHRVRHQGGEWRDVGAAIDTGRPYRIAHSDGSGRSMAVFFYDGGLAQAMAFDPATADAGVLADRIAAAGGDGLVSTALDGETFGHHHHFGELGLAYALEVGLAERGIQTTNYAAYLAQHPPVDEVELVPGEGTAWSCAHGVGRWIRDCGCSTDALPGWDQEWRTPLRAALDIVREAAVDAFEGRGAELLRDPWAARDDYVRVRLGDVGLAAFMDSHARRGLSDDQKVDLRGLLEAQRHAMVMYASCGWFFADVSGIETVYVLRSAARVLRLLRAAGCATPTDEFLAVLGEAKSNKPDVGTGVDVWREHVVRAAVTPRRIAEHVALIGHVRALEPVRQGIGHVVEVTDQRLEQRGRIAVQTSHVRVRSLSTGRRSAFALATVHLGGLDFHGVARPYPGDEAFAAAAQRVWDAFPTIPVARLLRLVAEVFDTDERHSEEFDLEALLPGGQQEVVASVFSDLTGRFHEQYSRLYHDHRRILEMLREAGFDLPRDLRAAAELTLSAELEQQLGDAVTALGQGGVPDISAFRAIRDTTRLAREQGYRLDLEPVAEALSSAVQRATATALAHPEDPSYPEAVERWLGLCADLGVDIDVIRAQELVYEQAVKARAGRLGVRERDTVVALGVQLGFSPVAWTAAPT